MPDTSYLVLAPKVHEWNDIFIKLSQKRFSGGKIYFFRHGQTYLNKKGLNSGQTDCELTPRGRMAAVKLVQELPTTFDWVFSSPLSRSIETLEIAFDRMPNQPKQVIVDPRLSEKSLGILEGKPRVHITEYDRGDIDYAPPGGETYRSLGRRCLSFLVDLDREIQTGGRMDPNVVIFTHMGPLRVFGSCFGMTSTPQQMMAGSFSNLHRFVFRLADFRLPKFFFLGGALNDTGI